MKKQGLADFEYSQIEDISKSLPDKNRAKQLKNIIKEDKHLSDNYKKVRKNLKGELGLMKPVKNKIGDLQDGYIEPNNEKQLLENINWDQFNQRNKKIEQESTNDLWTRVAKIAIKLAEDFIV